MSSESMPIARRSIGAQVMSAVAWRSGSQMVAQLIMWSATFFVIRILSPQDYGLFAMSQSVLVFLSLLNGQEFVVPLIRAPSLDRLQVRQTFGLLLLLNLSIAIAQVALAPAAARYFHHPVIARMLILQSLLYLANPFITLPAALLSRELNYRVQAKVNLASALVGAGVSLGGALGGLGVWTLVAAPLCAIWTRAIAMTATARLAVMPSFRLAGAGTGARFGGAMLLSSLFWLIQTQADVVIGGRTLDPHHLGLYTEGLFLAQIVTSKFVPPLNDVAFSAYAKLQEDRAAVVRAFEKSVRLIMFGALPFYAGLAVTADMFVRVVLGDRWVEAAAGIAILASAMPFVTLQILFTPATTALGHPRVQVWSAAAGALVMPAAFLVGVHWGPTGLAWCWLAAFPLLTAITAAMAMPIIGTNARSLARAIAPSLTTSLAMAAVVLVIGRVASPIEPLSRLAIMVAGGCTAYAGFAFLLAREVVDELRMLAGFKPRIRQELVTSR